MGCEIIFQTPNPLVFIFSNRVFKTLIATNISGTYGSGSVYEGFHSNPDVFTYDFTVSYLYFPLLSAFLEIIQLMDFVIQETSISLLHPGYSATHFFTIVYELTGDPNQMDRCSVSANLWTKL
jgi:hypothetical protein